MKRPVVEELEFTEEEAELMQKHELTAEQIAFRREIRANFGRRAKEEYAEDAESCFLASGDCIFDVDVIEQRLKEIPEVVTGQTDGGRLITSAGEEGQGVHHRRGSGGRRAGW